MPCYVVPVALGVIGGVTGGVIGGVIGGVSSELLLDLLGALLHDAFEAGAEARLSSSARSADAVASGRGS